MDAAQAADFTAGDSAQRCSFSTCLEATRLHTLPIASCLLLSSPAWLHTQHYARLSRCLPTLLWHDSSRMLSRHFPASREDCKGDFLAAELQTPQVLPYMHKVVT